MQFLSDINEPGFFIALYLVTLFFGFAYIMYRSNKKSLEDFYRKYPKYDPRRNLPRKHDFV